MNPEEDTKSQEEVEEVPGETGGGLADVEVPDMGRSSFAEAAAIRAAAAGERVGGAARGVLVGVGSKLESPSPPDDDLSDLFEAPDMEQDNDVYVADLVSVDEEDVFGDGGADMSDLLEVPDEDIEVRAEDVEVEAPRPPSAGRTARRSTRPAPPSGISGIQ